MEFYQYYVEGETEKKLLEVLKQEKKYIKPGKVEVFNMIQNRITYSKIRPLKKNTVVVILFDTDKAETGCLDENIKFLKESKHIKKVICIPQCKNLEDELNRSCCKIKNISELLHCRSNGDFKRDFLSCTHKNLNQKLIQGGFNINDLWTEEAVDPFHIFKNEAYRIKQ